MNNRLEDLMYEAGITAEGCWDSMDNYDHEAIEKLIVLVVEECALIAGLMEHENRKNIGAAILDRFEVKANES